MIPTVEIRNVSDYAGQDVLVQGWLYNLRESGKLLFPLFRDGTGMIQGVVVKSAVSPEVFERVRKLTQESSVCVTGKVRAVFLRGQDVVEDGRFVGRKGMGRFLKRKAGTAYH